MGILFPAHHHPQFFIADGVPELFQVVAYLVHDLFIVFGAGKVKKDLEFGSAFILAVPALDGVFQPCFLAQRFLGPLGIVPEIGPGDNGVELLYFFLLGFKVKDSS